jgi:hypothetical protein
MAYASVSDVNARLGDFDPLSGSTQPTETEAGFMLDELSGKLNAVLGARGIAVPVTTPTYFTDWLRGLVAGVCVSQVFAIRFPSATGADAAGWSAEYWMTEWESALKMIAEGTAVPPELTDSGSRLLASTYLTDHPNEEVNLGTIAEPHFRSGKVY